MTTQKDLELFGLVENAIMDGLETLNDKLADFDGGNLLTLIAVFSKLAADAAIDYGINEKEFVASMRGTYRTMRAVKQEQEDQDA